MGRTVEKVKIQNYVDIYASKKGFIPESEIRSVEVDAIADPGAAYMCLSPEVISQLGLEFSHTSTLITANEEVERRIFDGAKITLLDRTVQMQVMENSDGTPSLIGYLVLEALDLVVDPKNQRVIGNPEHDGKMIIDLL